MKTRIALFLIALVALVIGVVLAPGTENISDYSPRAKDVTEQSFSGAAEHYAMLRRNVETGNLESGDYASMLAKVSKFNKESGNKDLGLDINWEVMGPTNFGGRTRDICFTSDGLLFAGGVSGGLFQSWDSGNTWFRVTGFKENLNVTSVEQIGNGSIFVGTGSLFDSSGGSGGSGFLGSGVYKSADNGVTWSSVDGLSLDVLSTSGDFTSTDVLYADPQNPNKLWVGSRGGLFCFDDSNGTVNDDFDGIAFAGSCQDMAISSDGNRMLVVLGTGVYRSNDAGVSWSTVTGNGTGELSVSGANRVGLAISPQDPNYVYALISVSGRMGGVYASTDGGITWFNIWPENDIQNTNIDIDPFGENTQGRYDLVITVDPTNKERVIVGGVTLWEGGINIQPQKLAFNFGFGANYVHSDIHHFEWLNNQLYIGCDGGVFKSNDVTVSDSPIFVESNFGYNTTQFYGIGISTTGKVNGGTQDNSTFLVGPNSTLGLNQFGGDGFDTDISAVSDLAQFATSQNGPLGRSFDGGSSFNGFYDAELNTLLQDGASNFPFINVVRLFENTNDPFSEQIMKFVANEDTIPSGTTITVLTNNLNQPVEHVLEDTLFIRPQITLPQEVITETEDSLITLIYDFDEIDYSSEDFSFTETIEIGITEVTVTLPNDNIVIDESTLEGIVTVTVQFTEDIEVATIEDVTLFNVPDTLEIIDPYTSLFATYTYDGIYVTRQALDGNTTPDWTKVVSGNFNVNAIEFSLDGNHMYLASSNGNVTRISGFHNFWGDEDVAELTQTRIFNTNGPAMGIGIDPNNSNRIAVAVAGYGGSGKVWITDAATTATQTNGTEFFDNIWFSQGQDFAGMPCYDVIITDNQATGDDVIMVGTEFGVWATNDLSDNNSWEQCSNNLGNVPVFDIKQQYRGPQQFIENPTNTGIVYIGTHGMGIWRSGGVVNVEELTGTGITSDDKNLLIFPNPASDLVNVEVNLNEGKRLSLDIYNISGQLVFTEDLGFVSNGNQIATVYIGSLNSGNYIMNVKGEGYSETGKLLVK